MTLLGEESCTPKPAKVKRLAARPGQPGVAWLVVSASAEGEQRLVLDADGLCLERSAAGGLVTIRRSPAEQARDIVYRKIDGRDALMFPLGMEVGPPELLESLTVELKWKDIGFDRFRLEDDRQHVVEKSQDGDQYRAVVRIEPPRPLPVPARLPINGPEFAPYLGESHYIKPHDENIVALARELTRGKTDALEAVKALSIWMGKNIEPSLIAETLTGPEVLACRKGKCSEFATLFASLARATGIPTRIVLGERMIPGQWGGHMWNEVYVGRWIPVERGRQRGRDVVRPGQADRPRDGRGDAAPAPGIAGELRDRDQGPPIEAGAAGGQVPDRHRGARLHQRRARLPHDRAR